ncbi:hypothetical protein GCM10010331_66730 [Streptomyces xanthochromogenes]|uniref:Secreted protein n=1 Tax=Streptomyces xanthochromogenes TaxID=67384 RepID=A0ABQ2ZRG3_9ACTN|nr:hypothetical protein GCM10010326_14720 [Streptomyces xanthochromogenes]GHB69446.1 hypothetical protein GCM10010331_66730 [Streptomyces xanthochromogenes]
MEAASALSGWLRLTTSLAAADRSETSQAVIPPKATTSTATTAPMIHRRPGSVVAAARSRSRVSAQARRVPGRGCGCGCGADRAADSRVSGSRTFGGFAT